MDEGISIADLVDISDGVTRLSFPVKPQLGKQRYCSRCKQKQNQGNFSPSHKTSRKWFRLFGKRKTPYSKAGVKSYICECGNPEPLSPKRGGLKKLKNPVSVNVPLYHGSPINNLKHIEPKRNFLKGFQHPQKDKLPPLVFLTPDIHIARRYADRSHELKMLLHRYLGHAKPSRSGSVYRVKTRNKEFSKILHPVHGSIYISTDSVSVKKELRADHDEPRAFVHGKSRMFLLLCMSALAYVFFWSIQLTFSVYSSQP
tara:strand:- start:4 stop:774 length:771 start_codon:yes stop_codon:yes gene_type:complete